MKREVVGGVLTLGSELSSCKLVDGGVGTRTNCFGLAGVWWSCSSLAHEEESSCSDGGLIHAPSLMRVKIFSEASVPAGADTAGS